MRGQYLERVILKLSTSANPEVQVCVFNNLSQWVGISDEDDTRIAQTLRDGILAMVAYVAPEVEADDDSSGEDDSEAEDDANDVGDDVDGETTSKTRQLTKCQQETITHSLIYALSALKRRPSLGEEVLATVVELRESFLKISAPSSCMDEEWLLQHQHLDAMSRLISQLGVSDESFERQLSKEITQLGEPDKNPLLTKLFARQFNALNSKHQADQKKKEAAVAKMLKDQAVAVQSSPCVLNGWLDVMSQRLHAATPALAMLLLEDKRRNLGLCILVKNLLTQKYFPHASESTPVTWEDVFVRLTKVAEPSITSSLLLSFSCPDKSS